MTKKWSAVSWHNSRHNSSTITDSYHIVSHRMTLLSFHTWRQTWTCPTTCGNAMPRLGGKVSLSNHSLQIRVVYRWSLVVITAKSLLDIQELSKLRTGTQSFFEGLEPGTSTESTNWQTMIEIEGLEQTSTLVLSIPTARAAAAAAAWQSFVWKIPRSRRFCLEEHDAHDDNMMNCGMKPLNPG